MARTEEFLDAGVVTKFEKLSGEILTAIMATGRLSEGGR